MSMIGQAQLGHGDAQVVEGELVTAPGRNTETRRSGGQGNKHQCFTVRGKKRGYLEAFVECGRLDQAADQVGIHRNTHYWWMNNDPQYAAEFETARGMADDRLEADIIRRGFHVENPNPLLAMFYMKKAKPEYRDNYNINVKHEHTITVDDARAQLAALFERDPSLLTTMQKLVGNENQHLLDVAQTRIHVENEAEGVAPPNDDASGGE